jgi:hypothetical protein
LTEDSFFLSTHTTSSVHSHSSRLRRRYHRSILTALMRPYPPIIGCPEMNHITITDSYYALGRYRRGDILFLPAKTVTFQPLPSDFTFGPYLRRILFYTLARPVYARFARFATPFYPVPFFISRDFTSLFRDITLHCFEIFL